MSSVMWSVPWVGVAVAAITHFFFGAVWFMGIVGKHYGVALGRNDPPGQKPSTLAIVGPFVCSLVIIVTTAMLQRGLGVTGYGEAVGLGALIGVGFLTPMVVNIAINPNFPRPFFYSLLNAPFFVLGSVISNVVLVALS
ncbi:MAG: DUF1761 domain-containing protein [Deltaproteobacteria bacterium]|nr:DUF1761 domain-containing protein [Deltaproteobacteria bacterium]